MLKAIVTTRVVRFDKINEDRDCLDERLSDFLISLGVLPILMPNCSNADNAVKLAKAVNPDILILSGGNNITPSLYKMDTLIEDNSSRRDENEKRLLDYVVSLKKKVLGICRGAQMINVYFKGRLRDLKKVSSLNHAATKHKIEFADSCRNLGFRKKDKRQVNSFHRQGFLQEDLGCELLALAKANDQTIEMLTHKSLPIIGILWHPERPGSDKNFDRLLLERFLTRNDS